MYLSFIMVVLAPRQISLHTRTRAHSHAVLISFSLLWYIGAFAHSSRGFFVIAVTLLYNLFFLVY